MIDEDYEILKYYRDGRNGPQYSSEFFGVRRAPLMQVAFSIGYNDFVTPPHEFLDPQVIVDKVRDTHRKDRELFEEWAQMKTPVANDITTTTSDK